MAAAPILLALCGLWVCWQIAAFLLRLSVRLIRLLLSAVTWSL
jgi:hypothetical protein